MRHCCRSAKYEDEAMISVQWRSLICVSDIQWEQNALTHHCGHWQGGWIPPPGVSCFLVCSVSFPSPPVLKLLSWERERNLAEMFSYGWRGEVEKVLRPLLYSKKETHISLTNQFGSSWLVNIVDVDLETKVQALEKSLRCRHRGPQEESSTDESTSRVWHMP